MKKIVIASILAIVSATAFAAPAADAPAADCEGVKVKSVDLKVKMVTQGYQRDEYQTPVFEGVTVHFEPDNTVPTNKNFVPDRYPDR